MITAVAWLITVIIAGAFIRLRERWILPLLAIALVLAVLASAGVVR